MNSIADEPTVDYDEAFSGGVTPRPFANPHEPLPCQTPTASDPHPGRFRLDDEETDMNLARLIADERTRLKDQAGDGVRVLVTRCQEAFSSVLGSSDADHIRVSLHWEKNGYAGSGDVRTADVLSGKRDLSSVCDAVLADYRQQLAASSVPAVAEEAGAA